MPTPARALLPLCLAGLPHPAPAAPPAAAREARSETDVATELARLAADSAAERARAERWLAAHLAREHYPELAEALRGGGAELRRRTAQALAARDASLELVVLLLTEREAGAREVGERALSEMLARWSPSWDEPPKAPRTIPAEWLDERGVALAFDATAGALGDLLDRLARLGGVPVPLVLDPPLDPLLRRQVPLVGPSPARAELAAIRGGDWIVTLHELAGSQEVSFEVHGQRDAAQGPGRDGDRPWVRVCKRGAEGEATAEALVARWCRAIAQDPEERVRAASARALAALGWPAALLWLEERWMRLEDDAALQGVLLAAGRGRVAPGLADARRVRALLAATEAGLDASAPGSVRRAELVGRALAAVGPGGARGEVLADVVVEGWSALSPRARWLRLVALQGTARDHGEALAAARGVLASDAGPALALEALRVLAAGTLGVPQGAGPRIGAPARLLRHGLREGSLGEIARSLAALGASAGGVPAEGAGGPPAWLAECLADRRLAAAVLEWGLGAGRAELAQPALEALLRSPAGVDAAVEVLRAASGAGRAAGVRALFEAARTEGAAWRRLALRAGLSSAEEREAALERLLGRGSRGPEELADLAELAADPRAGARALEALVAEIAAGTPAAVLGSVYRRALAALRRARMDGEAVELEERLRRAAARADHPIAGELMRLEAPARAAAPRDLDLLDRRLDLEAL